ncbi:putative DNA polymerase III delta subunit [Waddlia chondrophila 2032/99]|uniref:DNA polymerase III subunit delta n=2 Tax=Waddlia chondrophila TaxID=71667 RepID=D6YW29_WADCW|nr:DNA polymerase III subunit delta [Waddlia chondrophila]ADI38340.1 putative DNA polymerase III delta subunit [Waddlia chondrophila WSU 86-1044]CCB91423.1 putative DNA polymerase III delta subunit [Waddlia chondrophila 2032/99]
MKFGNRKAFDKHLKEAGPHHFASVYLLISADYFERKQLVTKLCGAVLNGSPLDEHHLKKLDGAVHSVHELMRELGSFNFFAKKRVVIYENAGELKKEDAGVLKSYYEHPNPSVFLVLSSSSVNRGSSFYKQTEKAGVILDIEPEKPWEKEAALSDYAAAWFKKNGKKTASGVNQALVKSVNNDQAQLLQEMEKILCYLGENEEVSFEDLRVIGSGQTSYTVWQLGDAVFSRKGKEALEISNQLLGDGESLIGLLRALRMQFQTRLLGATAQPEEVQSRVPYLRGPLLHKQIQQALQYGAESCREGVLLIDEAERLAKNSGIADRCILETLMIKLAVL